MQRPTCDGDGNYQSVRCIPGQTCFCVDEEGNRIFGEAVNTANIQISMRCECSRLAVKARKLLNSQYPVLTSRCDSKGSFDQLQCVDDMCVCVDMACWCHSLPYVQSMSLSVFAFPLRSLSMPALIRGKRPACDWPFVFGDALAPSFFFASNVQCESTFARTF
uniref:Uncharacterized protein n=1 Tax=Anopheles atroparvus TaxID=41427 RepID=A0A182J2H6_ANOAO